MIKSQTGDFYEVGVRYDKTQEDGTSKKVTEKYAVDAVSFGEAEASIVKEMETYISGEYKLTSNSLANYHEVVITEADNADRYYKVRAAFITFDDKTERVKRSNTNFLVQASSLRNAIDNFDTFMGSTMIDYSIVSVQETKLMDIFFHVESNNKVENGHGEEETAH